MSTAFNPDELAGAEQARIEAQEAIHRAKLIVDRSRELILNRCVDTEPLPTRSAAPPAERIGAGAPGGAP